MTYTKILSRGYGLMILEKGSPLEQKITSEETSIVCGDKVRGGKVEIAVYYSMVHPDHSITAYLTNDIEINVNVNAYEHFLEEIEKLPLNPDDQGLYPLNLGHYGEIEICGSLARQLKAHNWAQYAPHMAEMCAQRERDLERIRKHPNIDPRIGNPSAHN